MTSVPKPLKFLRTSYEPLKQCYEKIIETKTKEFCADIVSVLGMTISEKRECLKYRFLSTKESVGSWGHEYVRHLTAELTEEWNEMDKEASKKKEADTTTTTSTTDGFTVIATEDVELDIEPVVVITKEDLLHLSKEIVNFYMSHNAEAEACDLLMEIEHVELLINYTEKDTYQRVCLYLLGKVAF
jgi:26S proteasome regulatory subunit N1